MKKKSHSSNWTEWQFIRKNEIKKVILVWTGKKEQKNYNWQAIINKNVSNVQKENLSESDWHIINYFSQVLLFVRVRESR